jgi:uncharacterized protein (TIGR02265 family)
MSYARVDLEEAFDAVHLHERLESVPREAAIRGVFFEMIESALRRHGLATSSLWAPQKKRRRIFQLYSMHEYLPAFATAAALIDSDPIVGMREIYSDGARFFATTWFGRALREFIRPDPTPALRWIERSHEHFVNYGGWRLELRGAGHAVLHMFDEYVWIEGAHLGGCEGLLLACGVRGTVTHELDAPFAGRLDIRWQQPS